MATQLKKVEVNKVRITFHLINKETDGNQIVLINLSPIIDEGRMTHEHAMASKQYIP
jgi:hypothetical protein